MTKSVAIFIAALGLMLGAGWFLAHLRSFQHLGIPGVKMSPEPTLAADGTQISSNSVYLPPAVLNFEGEKIPVAAEVLSWLPKDTTYGQRLYRAPDGFQAAMNVVLMGSDRTSIHKPEYCLVGMGWNIGAPTADTIPIAQPHAYELPVMKIEGTRNITGADGVTRPMKAVMVFWFVADHQLTSRHNERMKWMARDMILGGVLQRWAYVSCFTIFSPGMEAPAYERLTQLIAAAVPHFQLAAGSEHAKAR